MNTLLAFIAHPDDEAYSFAGTLALAARQGWRCIVLAATHGERGERHDGGDPTPDALAEAREDELTASCNALRIEPPQFWGLPDGQLHAHRGEARRIARLIETHRPSLLLTHGADGAYGHPDHIAVHRWVSDAWVQAGRPCPLVFPAFPPGLFIPQYEKCRASGIMGDPPLLAPTAIGAPAIHYEVDITARRDAKRAAIAAHQSQLPGGDPARLFPQGIVDALLAVERFHDANGQSDPAVARLLEGLVA